MRTFLSFLNGTAISLVLCSTTLVFATTPNAMAQDAVIARGMQIFADRCATCHGHDGKGGGELGKLLRTPPPDLTKIAENAGGQFPVVSTFNVIVGGLAIPAHGGEGMPVWGHFFLEEALEASGLSDLHAADIASGRVLSLVYFMESIQE